MSEQDVVSAPSPSPCWRVDLGRRDYLEAWDLQKKLVIARQAETIPDVLLLGEHPPTYTLGRGGNVEHLLVGKEELANIGASFVETDRGGDITFHGPGQIVGYPILDLKGIKPDVQLYLRQLEEVLIQTLARFGIDARPVGGLTGVWHAQGKVAAIGVRVSRWVTSHGFALNVSTDLSYFNRIVPCGIVGKNVTSMESILGKTVPKAQVADALSTELGHVFNRSILVVSAETLIKEVHVPVG
jgi:lipoate-protein ligase B